MFVYESLSELSLQNSSLVIQNPFLIPKHQRCHYATVLHTIGDRSSHCQKNSGLYNALLSLCDGCWGGEGLAFGPASPTSVSILPYVWLASPFVLKDAWGCHNSRCLGSHHKAAPSMQAAQLYKS